VLVVLLVTRTGKPPAPATPGPSPVEPGPATGAPTAAPASPGAVAAAPDPEMAADPPPNAFHGGEVDEGTLAVRAYQVSWKRLEAYIAAVSEIRRAGQRDAALMARLRQPAQVGEVPAAIAARLEAMPEVKAILDRRGLTALDLVLMPPSVAAGQNAYALEQEGRPLPPDQQNVSATALYRENLPRMDELAKAFRAELKHLSPAAATQPPTGR